MKWFRAGVVVVGVVLMVLLVPSSAWSEPTGEPTATVTVTETATATETVTESVVSEACGEPSTVPCRVVVEPESDVWNMQTGILFAGALSVALLGVIAVTLWGNSGD